MSADRESDIAVMMSRADAIYWMGKPEMEAHGARGDRLADRCREALAEETVWVMDNGPYEEAAMEGQQSGAAPYEEES